MCISKLAITCSICKKNFCCGDCFWRHKCTEEKETDMKNDFESKVREFMDKHKLHSQIIAGHPPIEERIARIRYILEEAQEFVEAVHEEDLVGVADALGDLLYVTIGAFIAYGIPVNSIFEEVHKSNMTKVALNKAGKGGKGKEFQQPNILEALEHPNPLKGD